MRRALRQRDINTLFAIHYPANTTVTLDGSTGCQSLGAYHSNTSLDAAHGNADVP